MIRGFAAALAAGVAITVTLAGCGADTATPTTPSAIPVQELSKFYNQEVTWTACLDSMQCAKVLVPLKYDDPAGATVSLALARLPSRDPNSKIGSLLLNPGGPGGSGIQYAQGAEYELGPQILARYDIVGLDPRGVGKSQPIDCLNDAQTDQFVSIEGPPADAAQTAAVLKVSKLVGQTCAANSPALTPNVGTVSAARDMDIVRAVLGDEKLNYLGKSYGTFLGLTYADLFPTKVGRFVLDGVIDPTLTNDGLARGQAEGFQLALSRFIANCPKHADCPLPKSPQAGLAKIQDWLGQLARKPIKAMPGRPLTRPLAVNGILGSLYEQSDGWPALRFALDAGFKGDGVPMEDLVDSFLGRSPDGRYSENTIDALYAVNCLDRVDRADAVQTQKLASEWAQTAPTFGPDLAWGNYPCHDWPAPATDAPHAIKASGADPILLVGNINDPATPYPWAVAVSKQLDSNALITFVGDGHTSYRRGSDCVDSKVDAYLLQGTLPTQPARC